MKDRTEYHRAWRAANPEKVYAAYLKWEAANPEYQREYEKRNLEKRRKYKKEWRAANRERVQECHRLWLASHPEYHPPSKPTSKEQRQAYRSANPERYRNYDRKWRDKNPEYIVWRTMARRCSNPDNKSYFGKGIKVCKRWLKFENFLADIGKRPSPKHSLSRLGDVGNYKPGNVVWGTRAHQAEQKRIKRAR